MTNMTKLSPLFFTGRKLRPPGMGIEATEFSSVMPYRM